MNSGVSKVLMRSVILGGVLFVVLFAVICVTLYKRYNQSQEITPDKVVVASVSAPPVDAKGKALDTSGKNKPSLNKDQALDLPFEQVIPLQDDEKVEELLNLGKGLVLLVVEDKEKNQRFEIYDAKTGLKQGSFDVERQLEAVGVEDKKLKEEG